MTGIEARAYRRSGEAVLALPATAGCFRSPPDRPRRHRRGRSASGRGSRRSRQTDPSRSEDYSKGAQANEVDRDDRRYAGPSSNKAMTTGIANSAPDSTVPISSPTTWSRASPKDRLSPRPTNLVSAFRDEVAKARFPAVRSRLQIGDIGGIAAPQMPARQYAHAAKVKVPGLDHYRSPEHKYPVAIDRVADALGWLRAAVRRAAISRSPRQSASSTRAMALR